jgi:flavin reductase (DIM6/NTAB) family NADH-FMN oxidoreductase RutF
VLARNLNARVASDVAAFRAAMGLFPTGITIISSGY